jgi:hypothetical protein
LRYAARTPSWRSASTWSCISAISGDTTIARAVAQQRGHLVAERLARARWHEHQRVPARGDVLDDRLLRLAKRVVAETRRSTASADRGASSWSRTAGAVATEEGCSLMVPMLAPAPRGRHRAPAAARGTRTRTRPRAGRRRAGPLERRAASSHKNPLNLYVF